MNGQPIPRYLEPEECLRIIGESARHARTGKRNAAVFALMYGAGLRVGEVLALRVGDIDRIDGKMRVKVPREGKTGERVVYCFASVAPYVTEYMRNVRRFFPMSEGTDRLFVSWRAQSVNRSNISRELARIARIAGVTRPEEHDARGQRNAVRPHMLRHSHAMTLLKGGEDLPTIQRSLGHASLGSTGVYLRCTEEILKDMVDRY